MKRYKRNISLLITCLVFLFQENCIVPFTPELTEDEELLVVEGTFTDSMEPGIFSISKTFPSWKTPYPRPLKNCKVWITDDAGGIDTLSEKGGGKYATNPAVFRGVPGRTYTLHVRTSRLEGTHNYESVPVRMIPVPPIKNIRYEKKIITQYHQESEACQIYLSATDAADLCEFFRWKYTETWQIHIPYEDVVYKDCWISTRSNEILIKSSRGLSENTITNFPLNYIPNTTDKLAIKYSILVDQYSLNEDEYMYWESMKNIQDEVGGLYDIIPSEIPNNIFGVEHPDVKVLGYFSVSAVASKRFFITEAFPGLNTAYLNCVTDTIYNPGNPVQGLGTSFWLLIDDREKVPPYIVVSEKNGCGDCRTRGTSIKPDFWDDDQIK